MLVLSIFSAVGSLSVGVSEADGMISEYRSADLRTTEQLVRYIDIVMRESGKKASDLSCVAVTTGPGSYGGLRGGIAVAKGLAEPLGIPIVAVPTLEAVARSFSEREGTLFVALPAMKDDYNVAVFGSSKGAITRLTEDFVAPAAVIAGTVARTAGDILLISTDGAIFDAVRRGASLSSAGFAEARFTAPSAGVMAGIAMEKFSKGEMTGSLAVLPKYSHAPNIREYKRKL